jgi:aminopeptidase N
MPGARFPCFDEPALKATFDVAVTAQAGDMVVSNGRVVSDTPGPGSSQHTVRFATTPRLPTYLVAIAVGDFVCIEGRADTTPVRVCATPERAQLMGFALEAATRALPYFNRYYGIPYPFDKLDVVARPDFAAGAMENAAAIFYRESLLLVDERSSAPTALRGVANVMAHEIAHQWFGDLVTMRWWDDIWLNEGFATWAANKALEGWRGWQMAQDNAGELWYAMGADQLASAHAIRTHAENPAEIEESFDLGITYNKSASVLRMVEHYLGEEVFRAGVHAYLTAHAYGNATAEDFWGTLASTSGKPVDRIMASFVDQSGVPLVSIAGRCDGGHTQLTIDQERFVLGTDAPRTADRTWVIPVCLKRPGEEMSCVLIDKPSQAVNLPDCAPSVLGMPTLPAITAHSTRRIDWRRCSTAGSPQHRRSSAPGWWRISGR